MADYNIFRIKPVFTREFHDWLSTVNMICEYILREERRNKKTDKNFYVDLDVWKDCVSIRFARFFWNEKHIKEDTKTLVNILLHEYHRSGTHKLVSYEDEYILYLYPPLLGKLAGLLNILQVQDKPRKIR